MNDKKELYIQMFSIHGLLRAHNMELGYDADTGGQIKYLIELCNFLSKNSHIRKIDLFTRFIKDKSHSDDYNRKIDCINQKFRIIRIQCGGKKYLRKELLWPFLDEFIDRTIKFIQKDKDIPDLVHGHYPDAGYIAKELAIFFGIPFIYTAHSLGRPKKSKLLIQKNINITELNRQLKIDYRIQVEESILKAVDLVITSTNEEIQNQYAMYENCNFPTYKTIPPGIDSNRFFPYYYENFSTPEKKETALFAKASVQSELEKFFQHPEKPMILALCRPDKRKNIEGLIEAYGKDQELQAIANLAIFAGIRKDISQKEPTERDVLTQMLLLMDKYNLYGKMAIPKRHDFEHEVPALYRLAAVKKGVFVNPSLTEPFGLTLLEAMSCGLPVVSTSNGGPRDIVTNCNGGILVNPKDSSNIAKAIKTIIIDHDKWHKFSKNGILKVRKIYSWTSHVKTYIQQMKSLLTQSQNSKIAAKVPPYNIEKRLSNLKYMIISDIDNTLIGGDSQDISKFIEFIQTHSDYIGFGVATGRRYDSALAILEENGIPIPDILISSVGSQIRYGDNLLHDKEWTSHISKNWNPDLIKKCLEKLNFLTPQKESAQTGYKLSYDMEFGEKGLAQVHQILRKNKLSYNLIYSHEKYLDILPYRASKGKAIRYLSCKWQISLENFLTCGDSGNDAEMFRGEPCGVVVGNYSPELESLKNSTRRIYFAEKSYVAGIMEGLAHYHFINKAIKDYNA